MLEQQDGRKHSITLRQLLNQTSGLAWYEWGGSGRNNWYEFQSAPNWVEYILNQPLLQEPGTLFNYSTGNTHLLAAALEEAYKQGLVERRYQPVTRDNLFDKLAAYQPLDSAEYAELENAVIADFSASLGDLEDLL